MITNVELDHHARWGSRAELEAGFARFAAPAAGVVLGGERGARPDRIERRRTPRRSASTRRSPGPADARACGPGPPQPAQRPRRARGARARGLRHRGRSPRRSQSFPGMLRRQQRKGSRAGAEIYDDYAHHPTEVAATLEALRELEPRRLIAVFQPHLYSRTKALARAFRRRAGRGRRDRRARRLPGARAARGRPRGRQRPRRRPCGGRPRRRQAGAGGCATPRPRSAPLQDASAKAT